MDNIYHVIIDLHLNDKFFNYINVQSFDSYKEARKVFNILVTNIRNQPNNPWFYGAKALKSHCTLSTSHNTNCRSRWWYVDNEHTGQYCKINLTEYESKNTENLEYCKAILDSMFSKK